MESIQQDNETINLKKIIIYYFRHWRCFLVAGIISLIPALLYLILVPRTYEMMTKILLLEDKGTSSSGLNIGDASGLMKTFGLGGISGGSFNMDDELAKLMSTTTLQDVVLKLGLNIVYYKPNAYKYKMYEDAPLLLFTDSVTQKNLESPITFNVDIDKTGKVKVVAKNEDVKKHLEFKSLPAEIKLEEGTFVLSFREEEIKPLSLKLEIVPSIWAAQDLSESLLFDEFAKNANVVEISCTDYEKKRGLDLLRTLVDVYNSQEDSIKKAEGGKSVQFLDERLNAVVANLTDVEVNIERYKLKNKMTDIEYDVQFYADQMKELQMKIIELEAQTRLVDLLDAYVKDPQNKYNLVPILLASGEGENSSKSVLSYNEALLERLRLLQSTKGDNPLIGQMNKQVDQLRESVFLSIDNAKKSLTLTLDDLKGKEKIIIDKMGVVPTLEREYIDFRRQQEIYQALYLILLQKREDFLLSIGENKDRARIIEAAYVKKKSIAPRKLYALIGMIIFTMVVPVAFLFGKEQFVALKKEYKETK
ncbi:GumC family protein [Parabacteroides sp.]